VNPVNASITIKEQANPYFEFSVGSSSSGIDYNNGLIVKKGAGSTDYANLGVRTSVGGEASAFISYNSGSKGLYLSQNKAYLDGSLASGPTPKLDINGATLAFQNTSLEAESGWVRVLSNPADNSSYNKKVFAKDYYIADNASSPNYLASRAWVLNPNRYAKQADWDAAVALRPINWTNVTAQLATPLTLTPRPHRHDLDIVGGGMHTSDGYRDCDADDGYYDYNWSGSSWSVSHAADDGFDNCRIRMFCPSGYTLLFAQGDNDDTSCYERGDEENAGCDRWSASGVSDGDITSTIGTSNQWGFHARMDPDVLNVDKEEWSFYMLCIKMANTWKSAQ